MGTERRRQLAPTPGEQVDDAAGHVGDAEHLGEIQAGQRILRRQDRDADVAAGERRGQLGDQAEQRRRVGGDDPDHSGRLGERERQKRRRDRVHAAEHRRDLVGPAGVVQEHVDGGGALLAARADRVAAGLQCLGRAVQDLPAVVGGARRPGAGRLARGGDRVADVLARAAREVEAVDLVVAAGLRAHERAADPQLVGLADRQPLAHRAIRRYGRSPAAPPSRPKPDSL